LLSWPLLRKAIVLAAGGENASVSAMASSLILILRISLSICAPNAFSGKHKPYLHLLNIDMIY
jgi:hypothetical protein